MSYMVMECHPSYAVVLSSDGRFIKAANLGYQVGQRIDKIIPLRRAASDGRALSRRITGILASAACLCLMLLGAWHYILSPAGTVQMTINPDVLMSVNRLNYVTGLTGLNEDGKTLIGGVSTFGKKMDKMADELADLAKQKGFLKNGGRITLTVRSGIAEWKTAAEDILILELDTHFESSIAVTLSEEDGDDDLPASVSIPVPGKDEDDDEESSDDGLSSYYADDDSKDGFSDDDEDDVTDDDDGADDDEIDDDD